MVLKLKGEKIIQMIVIPESESNNQEEMYLTDKGNVYFLDLRTRPTKLSLYIESNK